MPTTEAAQNDGSHLTAAQWEGMQKVLNHIYDYRTEEWVDMRLLARDGILTFRQWLRPLTAVPQEGQQARHSRILRDDQGAHSSVHNQAKDQHSRIPIHP